MTISEIVDPDSIATYISMIGRAPDDVFLRQFHATIIDLDHDPFEEIEIGSITGWIGFSIPGEDLYTAADAISTDAEALGATAAAVIDAHPDRLIETALLLDRMYITPGWCGNRLTRRVIDDLTDLLRLDPATTAVVLMPEPQKEQGGPYEDGHERDLAMARLREAYRRVGLEPWRDSPVWWLPFTQGD